MKTAGKSQFVNYKYFLLQNGQNLFVLSVTLNLYGLCFYLKMEIVQNVSTTIIYTLESQLFEWLRI